MTIWIANTTRQEMELQVRLPEMNKVYTRKISSGRQDEIKGLSPAQDEAVLRHIIRYGAVKRQDLHGKAKGFMGLAYSTDKAFKMEEFHYGYEDVLDNAENRSVTEAVKSAMASDMKMRDPSTGERLSRVTETEMVEEQPEDKKKGKRMKITIDPMVTQGDSVPMN